MNDVTFIDKAGERLLRAMSKKGAELIASGMYTKHLLEKVKATAKDSPSKFLICFFVAVVVTASVPADCVQAGPAFASTSAKRPLDTGLNANVASFCKSDLINGEGGISCTGKS
jgi:hypothetical protein